MVSTKSDVSGVRCLSREASGPEQEPWSGSLAKEFDGEEPTGGRVGASLGSANARLLVGQKREGASWSAKDLDGVEMLEFF